MSLHSFIKESTEPGLTAAGTTPEPARRYVQWKEDDVGCLLSDLECPGNYERWKENKSGFSKRVAEQVFKNGMYHEAIKFKVRWLESRFKIWDQQLTSPQVEQDESAILHIREKMFKEFPYYDRCKPIFTSTNSPVVQPGIAPAASTGINNNQSNEVNHNTIMKPEPIHMTNEPCSPTLETTVINSKRNLHPSVAYNMKKIKARKTIPINNGSSSSSSNSIIDNNCIYRMTEGITDERKVKVMELELELKKMDHQERMQEMKLEQLRLEIELQKLKRDTPFANSSD
ncbi:hypothetical protein INT48_001149 [Thamnidium elegans]|uniref:Uncharacterized protein n=1 Tax=Thamnidium elegans TaxID=101142 RepID=A0A8H7SPQ8_9FUNG|nr:hypothetical protein INT48_001149 [Thamnidium elegans]